MIWALRGCYQHISLLSEGLFDLDGRIRRPHRERLTTRHNRSTSHPYPVATPVWARVPGVVGKSAYVENAFAMWSAVAIDARRNQTCFRAEMPRMTRLILRAPMPAERVARLLGGGPPAKTVVVEDIFGNSAAEAPGPTARILHMPLMVRPPAPAPAPAGSDDVTRIIRVSDPDEPLCVKVM